MIQEWTLCTIVRAAMPELADLFAQWKKALLLIQRRAIAISPTDDELMAAAAQSWYGRRTGGAVSR